MEDFKFNNYNKAQHKSIKQINFFKISNTLKKIKAQSKDLDKKNHCI